jgi:hypothetical protein
MITDDSSTSATKVALIGQPPGLEALQCFGMQ